MRERVVAVERDVDGDALAAQARGDRFGQLGVILDQKYSHWATKRGGSAVTARLQRHSPCCNRPFRRTASHEDPGGTRREEMRSIQVIAGLAALALVAAGCGGGAKIPDRGAARLEHFLEQPAARRAPRRPAPPARRPRRGAKRRVLGMHARARGHRLPRTEDLHQRQRHKVAIRDHAGNQGQPAFQRRNGPAQACSRAAVRAQATTTRISPQEQSEYLRAVACIRSHGVPNFPDPTFSGGGVHLPKTAGITSSRPRCARQRKRANR